MAITLPTDSIMTVDVCDRRFGHFFCKRRSLADLKYKEKEQKGRFREIDEKIAREEYTLDWSQSYVFLVEAKLYTSWNISASHITSIPCTFEAILQLLHCINLCIWTTFSCKILKPMEMTARLPTVCVNRYILNLTFLFGPIRFSLVDGLKLGATSSDILECVTYATIRQWFQNVLA